MPTRTTTDSMRAKFLQQRVRDIERGGLDERARLAAKNLLRHRNDLAVVDGRLEIVARRRRGEIGDEVEIDLERLAVFAFMGEMAVKGVQPQPLDEDLAASDRDRRRRAVHRQLSPMARHTCSACTCGATS